MKKVDKETG